MILLAWQKRFKLAESACAQVFAVYLAILPLP
jgi:hypothetical protein